MTETIHYNGKVRKCKCGLVTIQEYLIKTPDRELRQYLCFYCARDMKDSGIKIKKVREWK
jgi:hypothetical protein